MASKIQLAGILVVLGLGGTAAADIDTSIVVVPGPGAPQLEATIRGAGLQPLDAILLRDPRGVTVPATSIVPFRQGKETIAIAFVVEGGEVWVGNDTIEPEDSPALYLGTLNGIREGLDALDLAASMPPGSRGMLITYDDVVKVRVPLGPIARISGAAMGTQKDYYGRIGQSEAQAVAVAIAALEQEATNKKLLVIVSDGSDTNNEAAKGQLADLKKRAAIARIEVAAIVYKGYLSDPGTVISALTQRTVTVNSYEGIATELREAVRRATSQYTVRFAGERLRWDGALQDLVVELGFTGLDPVTVQMGPALKAPAETRWFLRWWAQLAAGLILVGVVIGGQRLRGSRSAI